MNDDIFIYAVDLHGKARAFVMPCVEGYTVYVDRSLPPERQIEACLHELDHIRCADFEKENIQEIEAIRHGKGKTDAVWEVEDTTGSER